MIVGFKNSVEGWFVHRGEFGSLTYLCTDGKWRGAGLMTYFMDPPWSYFYITKKAAQEIFLEWEATVP